MRESECAFSSFRRLIMPGLIKGRGAKVAPLRPLFDRILRLFALAALAGRDETAPHSHAASTLLAIELHSHADCMRVRGRCPPSGRGDPALESSYPKSSFTHSDSLLLSVFDISL